MQQYRGRRDAARFLDAWAPDLAGLLHQGWPALRYAGPRTINEAPGLLLTAPRNAAARFDAPLNAFLALSPAGLAAFFRDDLIGYARFNASVRWLGSYCLRYQVDLAGGSQQGPRTRTIPLDAIFDQTLDPWPDGASDGGAVIAPPIGDSINAPHTGAGQRDETSGNAM